VLPEAILEKRELLGTLRTAVRLLPGVQRQVVERHYVVGEMLQDIAESMGVTEARVSQICSEAVNAIRAHLGTMYEGVPDVAERAPGRRSRTAFVKVAGAPGRWKDVLAAAEGEWVVMAEVGSGV
jgi:RNA polymerase sigma factor for flagellar operon FliA